MNEKKLWIIVRSVACIIILITFLMMFVINPGINNDIVSSETLWEAVHPYHWLWDTVGLAGLIFFTLYVTGLAGKVIYAFAEPKSENSSGFIHVIGIGSILLTLCFLI